MKLANLLSQYLYTNKRLDLPGIGTFLLDPTSTIEPENSKNHRQSTPDGISFENNPLVQDAPELISYISSKTGKMKALATSDLDSHIQLAQQFLNIGKPFMFDGIGTLVKAKAGSFEFTPVNVVSEKIIKEAPEKQVHGVAKKESIESKYQAYLSTPALKNRLKKPILVLLILTGIGLAIWGGYTISTNNNAEEADNNLTTQTTPVITDNSQLKKPDSTTQIKKAPDSHKYVLEIAKAKRAFRRYNQLLDIRWKVQMETADSIDYKLYMLLPIRTDTTKVLDSLTVITGKKVYLENQN